MPLNLASVDGYVKGIRRLLQDKREPFRYTDNAIIAGLNLSILEAYRIRPDIFICRTGFNVPQYEQPSGDTVPIEMQFRVAIEYGAAAHILLSDEEDVQDSRANSFQEKAHDILVGVRPSPIQGGTPTPDKAAGSKAGAQPPQG